MLQITARIIFRGLADYGPPKSMGFSGPYWHQIKYTEIFEILHSMTKTNHSYSFMHSLVKVDSSLFLKTSSVFSHFCVYSLHPLHLEHPLPNSSSTATVVGLNIGPLPGAHSACFLCSANSWSRRRAFSCFFSSLRDLEETFRANSLCLRSFNLWGNKKKEQKVGDLE